MGISALNNLRFFIFEFLLITHCYFVLCSAGSYDYFGFNFGFATRMEKTTTQISHKYEEFEVLTKGVHF